MLALRRRTFATALIAFALSGCGAGGTPDVSGRVPADSAAAAAQTAISAAWLDHMQAAKRKDSVGVMALYSDDVVYVVPGAQEVHGRAAVDSMESAGLAAADVIDATHTTHGLQLVGDRAYEIGTIDGPVRPRGQAAHGVTFHFMALWQRQADGFWPIRHLVGST